MRNLVKKQRKALNRLKRQVKKARREMSILKGRPITPPVPDPNKRLFDLPILPAQSTSIAGLFGARDRVLADLGYKSYDAYLHSHEWGVIRRRVLCLDFGKCRACGGPATQVHHSAYNSWALRGVDLSCLHSICRECHEFVEFDQGQRRRPVESVDVLRRMIIATKGKTERKLLDQRALGGALTVGGHQHVGLSSLTTLNMSGMGELEGEIQATSQCNG